MEVHTHCQLENEWNSNITVEVSLSPSIERAVTQCGACCCQLLSQSKQICSRRNACWISRKCWRSACSYPPCSYSVTTVLTSNSHHDHGKLLSPEYGARWQMLWNVPACSYTDLCHSDGVKSHPEITQANSIHNYFHSSQVGGRGKDHHWWDVDIRFFTPSQPWRLVQGKTKFWRFGEFIPCWTHEHHQH